MGNQSDAYERGRLLTLDTDLLHTILCLHV
jgi:hypothetical protein